MWNYYRFIKINSFTEYRSEINMEYIIRELRQDEIKLLDTFLYEAIFIPEGVQAPSKDIIEHPDLQIYIANFGKKDDICHVAEVGGKVIGAVWTRIIKDYGYVDESTPSLSISLLKEYRNFGIGTELILNYSYLFYISAERHTV